MSKQAWTQGEMIESKFWFPCIDDPQIKYPREVSVTVPKDFIVISNGDEPDNAINTSNDKKIHIWKEDHPNPAYLTSIVTGKFFKSHEPYEREIKLLYYVPEDKKDRVKRTLGSTSDAMKFFESYFGFTYPYSKYAQTTVKDFDYGGMENTSCTTLEEEILLDEKAAIDDTIINNINSSRSIISHELAHQWFGDLVTCMDWTDIWLNEGFVTYCEALYTEHIHNNNRKEEFHRCMDLLAANYFTEACNDYERPIVTNIYKYPDELFDRHSYKKGAWVLHMIRHTIGEKNFKESLNKYLKTYQYRNAKTEDFRRVLEEVSGFNLDSFFNQWVYTKGHPELEISFNKETKSIKVTQTQNDVLLDFEIEIALSNGSIKTYPFHVLKERDNVFEITKVDKVAIEKNIEWFSIDPELKVLKEIKSLSYEFQQLPMISNLIRNGQTIIERRQGIRAITQNVISSQNCEEIINLLKDVVLHGDFYYVSALAASKLGDIGNLDHIDKEIKKQAFQTIKDCFHETKTIKKIGRTLIRSTLVSAIGNYSPDNDFFTELKDIIKNGDESYYVEVAALLTIARYRNSAVFDILKEAVDRTNTFNDIIPRRAISAFANFKDTDDAARDRNSNGIRNAATSTLGEFLVEKDKKTIDKDVFMTLMRSLDDIYSQVRNTAYAVFETTFSPDEHDIGRQYLNQLLVKLEHLTNNDLFFLNRRKAQLCLFAIRSRHYSKMKKIVKNEREFNEYLMAKKQIRMKDVFGSKTW